MLPAAERLRSHEEFREVARRGRRAKVGSLVVTLAAGASSAAAPDEPTRSGFIVGRTVGGAVVRNRIRRRLRHLVAARRSSLTAGSRLVVRALPAAAECSAQELARDLDRALSRLRR